MDLSPLFRDVGRIATALELIARNTRQPEALDVAEIMRASQITLTAPRPALLEPAAAQKSGPEVVPSVEPIGERPQERYYNNKQFEPIPASQSDDARVLSSVRELMAEGHTTYMALAKQLNSRSVRTKNDKAFYASSVRAIMVRNGLNSSISAEALSRSRTGPQQVDAAGPPPAEEPEPVSQPTVAEPKGERQAGAGTAGAASAHPTDLEDMLSAKTRSRAQFARTFRGRGALASPAIDFEAAFKDFERRGGAVTKCPAAIDSTGWDHHNQRQAS